MLGPADHMPTDSRVARVVAALSCAVLLLGGSYALACYPGHEPWFNITVTVSPKTLPKHFAIRAGRLEKSAERDCVFADGTSFESYELNEFGGLAKSAKFGDGRPTRVKVPKTETAAIEVYCDPQRYATRGRLSYRPADRVPDKWTSHMDLDLGAIGHLITIHPVMSGSSIGDYLITRTEPITSFCAMSSDHLFDDTPAAEKKALGLGAISLADVAGARKHVGIDNSGRITAQTAAAASRSFNIFIDCYASKNIIEAKLRYALNKDYDPHLDRKLAAACNPRDYR